LAKFVVNNGLTQIANQLGAIAGALEMTHMQVGTGTTAPTVASTALSSASSPRVPLTATVSGQVLTLEGFWTTAQVNGDITEWGIFSALTGGTMLATGEFTAAFTKSSIETLLVTITITFASA